MWCLIAWTFPSPWQRFWTVCLIGIAYLAVSIDTYYDDNVYNVNLVDSLVQSVLAIDIFCIGWIAKHQSYQSSRSVNKIICRVISSSETNRLLCKRHVQDIKSERENCTTFNENFKVNLWSYFFLLLFVSLLHSNSEINVRDIHDIKLAFIKDPGSVTEKKIHKTT